jgi:ADP-ribose pyrophosphatase
VKIQLQDKMHPPKVIASQVLFDHPWVQVVVDTLDCQGKQRPYFYMESPVDAVATVGLTEAGEILLTHQYRHPIGSVIYDLPAGRLEPAEDPLEGARREFEEETGYFPQHIERLGCYNQFPGSLRVTTHLFFARDLIPTHQSLDEGEELEMIRLPVADVLGMITRGEVIDGSLQLGVLLADHKGLLHGDLDHEIP